MAAVDYRRTALSRLDGNWGLAVGSTFVASLLGAQGSGISFDYSDVQDRFGNESDALQSTLASDAFIGFFGALATIFLIWAIAAFILGGATRLGVCRLNQNMYHDKEKKFNDIFAHYDVFGRAFVLNLLQTLFIVLWSCLLIVPGIIVAYSYSQAFYIMEEDPNIRAYDALQISKQMMKGHKWEFFCLDLSFIGWAILSSFTIGIGFLFLVPYQQQAHCAFYNTVAHDIAPEVRNAREG